MRSALPLPFYEADGVTLYHGDAREIVPLLDGAVMVTDPPYGIAHASGWSGPWQGTQIANDSDTETRDQVLAAWSDRPALAFGTWRRKPPASARAALVWDKGPASGMGDLSIPWKQSWELIFVCGDGFSGFRDEGILRGHRVVTWASKGRQHPNEKPVTLMRALLDKCPPGVVVDPFMGSGPTLRAALDMGRPAIGIDLDGEWCEIAARRLSQRVLPLGGAL